MSSSNGAVGPRMKAPAASGGALLGTGAADRLTGSLTAYPTVVFTGLLMFCGVWWLLSVLLAGLDGDGDGPGHGHAGHAGHAGHSHSGHSHAGDGPVLGRGGIRTSRAARTARTGRSGRTAPARGPVARISRALRLGSLPLSFGLTLFAFGAWSVSLLGQGVLGGADGRLGVGAAVALGCAGVVGGVLFVGRGARMLAPIFETETAPERSATTGSLCRIRLLAPSARTGVLQGTADVVSGPTRGSTVRIVVEPDDAAQLGRGSLALLVAYDEDVGSFYAIVAPPGLEPD